MVETHNWGIADLRVQSDLVYSILLTVPINAEEINQKNN